MANSKTQLKRRKKEAAKPKAEHTVTLQGRDIVFNGFLMNVEMHKALVFDAGSAARKYGLTTTYTFQTPEKAEQVYNDLFNIEPKWADHVDTLPDDTQWRSAGLQGVADSLK